MTGADIVEHALKEIAILGAGDSASDDEVADALVQLNLMIKLDQARGVKTWRYREGRLFVVASQTSYDLPGANACNISELSETTLDASEASGQTELSVTSTTGFADGDVIGIKQDDNTIHWSTIASFVEDDTVTIDDALTAAATSGNKVYVYTTALERPLRIMSMRRELDSQETPLCDELAREEYFSLPNKSDTGPSVQYFYDPQIPTGKLYLWPAPDSVNYEMNFTYLDQLQDIDASTETLDYPQEWLSYLVSNLALRLAPQHGKQPSEATVAWAVECRQALSEWDIEQGSVFF